MSKTDDVPNPQAFPRPGFEQCAGMQDGMTLRDWFAGQALAGIMGNGEYAAALGETAKRAGKKEDEVIALMAFEVAAAMLRARGVTAPQAGEGGSNA